MASLNDQQPLPPCAAHIQFTAARTVRAPKYSHRGGGKAFQLINKRPPPWKLFVDQLATQAKTTIQRGARTDNLFAVAQAVVHDIEGMREPDTDHRQGLSGRDFGAYYAAVVWNVKSRMSEAEFEYGGAVRPGVPRTAPIYGAETTQRSTTPVWNGIRPQPGCGRDNFYSIDAPAIAHNNQSFLLVGSFGWPCFFGGSLAFTTDLADGSQRNCMVFYHTFTDSIGKAYLGDTLFQASFLRVLDTCQGEQTRFRDPRPYFFVDLTAFALCVERTHKPDQKYNRRQSKGVAVIPGGEVYGASEIPFFGYHIPEGGVVYRTFSFAGSVFNPFTGHLEPPRLTIFFTL